MEEQWVDIAGYEGICQVSNYGRLRSLDRVDAAGHKLKGRIRKHGIDTDGYHIIGLCKDGKMRTFKVHRLVMESFSGMSSTALEVNHIDGNKGNNHVDNLEWSTCKDNHEHAKAYGLKARGSFHGKSALDEDSAILAWMMIKNGNTLKHIANCFGVSESCINHLKQGRTWSWLLRQHS